LERFKKLSPTTANDDQVFFFAQYIQEIALLDASLLKYRASEIAAASLILSSRSLKKQANPWSKEMEKITGIREEDLQVVVEEVRGFVVEVNPKFLTTLKYKFSKPEYLEVASLPFKF
jgi:Cyclin, C-terminal domain